MLAADCIDVWTHRVGDVEPSRLSLLSRQEHERATAFAFARDRRTFLATRVMIRSLLSRYAPVPAEDWRFTSNAYGRPRIDAPALEPPLHFNLSHTHEFVVIAIARNADIGIDIESRIPDEFDTIAADFFSAREIRWLNEAVDRRAAELRFLQLWTLKEAYIKALGTGLSTTLDGFSIIPDGNGGAQLVERVDAGGDWWFRLSMLDGNCALSVAARLPGRRQPRLTVREYH